MPRTEGKWGRVAGDGWAQWPFTPTGRALALGSSGNETPVFRNRLRTAARAPPATGASPRDPMSDAPQSSSPATGAADATVPAGSESLEVIRKFAETYAQRTGTYFCSDPGVTAVVLEGLARHKDELGGALCPCRHYEDKEAEVQQAFWNCPCVPMRERKECHCMLFLTEDNPFRGETQTISIEEIKAHTSS